MKYHDSSLNGLKVRVCTKSVTHTHPKSNMPHQLFQRRGHNNMIIIIIIIKVLLLLLL